MRSRVWLSYDLSVDGPYEKLYAWLDAHGAIECGDALCTFFFEYQTGADTAEAIPEAVSRDLRAAVSFGPRDRIYLISKGATGGPSGRFIIGGRKNRAPWVGYSVSKQLVDDES